MLINISNDFAYVATPHGQLFPLLILINMLIESACIAALHGQLLPLLVLINISIDSTVWNATRPALTARSSVLVNVVRSTQRAK